MNIHIQNKHHIFHFFGILIERFTVFLFLTSFTFIHIKLKGVNLYGYLIYYGLVNPLSVVANFDVFVISKTKIEMVFLIKTLQLYLLLLINILFS